MKICFCIDTMESGGAERVASILCNEFASLGHYVELIMVSEERYESFYELNKKIKLIPLLSCFSKSKIFFFDKISALKKRFNSCNYDVVISFLPNVNYFVCRALKGNKKIVHIVSERNNPYLDPKNKIRRLLKEWAFKRADGVVFQTEDAKLYFKNKIRNETIIIKNPVIPVVKEIDILGKTNNTVLSVGRLEKQKNYELLIKAFYKFNCMHNHTSLKIYGDGSLKNKIMKMIKRYNLEKKVFLCGKSNNWITENANCLMFINSSLYEGMPNSLLEALVNGMPCIASDCPIGGSKELLSYDNGLLFENNNINDLIEKMEEIFKNKEKCNLFKMANLKIREMYSPKTIATLWIDFFTKVIAKRKIHD